MPLIKTRAAALACAIFAMSAGTASAAAPTNFRPFAPDSVWNLPLRPDAPISPSSSAWVGWLDNSVATNGTWINTTSCGSPLYWAATSTPTVKVTLNHPYMDSALIRAWSAVPIPPDAQPATCGDRNFSVDQVQPDGSIREWELIGASQASDGSWTAKWGGAINDVRTDRGIGSSLQWTDPRAPMYLARQSNFAWNVTATSISMDAGVVTFDDLKSGHIDHALAMATHDAASGKFLWPAQRTDGTSTDPNAIPEGAHLRIDPSVDLSKIPMTPMVRMVAVAAQTYGIVIRDKTYSVNVFYTEQPQAGQANPVPALLNGQTPAAALSAFPWSKLEVLNAPMCAGWAACSATNNAVINVDGTPQVGQPVTLDTTNSVLNYPRANVAWDLDGSGTYSTPGGTAVQDTVTFATPGPHTIGVRITTEDGSVVTGTTTINIAPVSITTTPTTTTPTTTTTLGSLPQPTNAPVVKTSPLAPVKTPVPVKTVTTPVITHAHTAAPPVAKAVSTGDAKKPSAHAARNRRHIRGRRARRRRV